MTPLDGELVGDCAKCGKPIERGQGFYTFDANMGACAAGTGNMKRAHSDCFKEGFYWTPPPEVRPCACRFRRTDEFSTLTLIEECGFHAKMRKQEEEAKMLALQIHVILKDRDEEDHGLTGNLRCILDHVSRPGDPKPL